MKPQRTYLAIDLKSFYASVECVSRGLDPLTTNLVVADASRTDKTICLAVSPSLKAYGIPGRARLFAVKQRVAEIRAREGIDLDFIIATPRMAYYMEVSSRVYEVYLRHISAEDIHVYSIDEVFIDATQYLRLYGLTAHQLAMRLVKDVLRETGITATAGIGPNMYLAKVAMDIEAKHSPADADGVRIAELDEMSYRRKYWTHRPLTDFWRIGRGIEARLAAAGLFTLGDVARCSLVNEEVLYRMLGVNAELLIDHAWGWEPCTMKAIKSFRASSHSLGSGQVLSRPYPVDQARTVVREMTDSLVLDLVEKRLVTDQIVLYLSYEGQIFKPAHGSVSLPHPTSSTSAILDAAMSLFDQIADPALKVRRIGVTAGRVMPEEEGTHRQLDLFEPPEDHSRERSRQEAILAIRRKFGKNAILSGFNYEEGATAIERNQQIGGHKA